jgi:lipid II:glycine glycyltransferase (peptidoglycan interpeptide bridge formation enzyme)
VFSVNILTREHTTEFIKKIPKKYKFAEFNLNIHNQPSLGKPYELIPQNNHLLDLIDGYNKLSSHYSSNTKRNLKKSQKQGLTLSKNIKPERIVELFVQNRGKQIKHFQKSEYTRLQALMYLALHRGMGITYGVFTHTNDLCAAGFFLYGNQHLTFLFSGSNEKAKETGAMTYLFDQVIREYSETQMILDFEGSNDPGLARFYKGFGAKEVHYSRLTYNVLPFPLKQLAQLKTIIRKPH